MLANLKNDLIPNSPELLLGLGLTISAIILTFFTVKILGFIINRHFFSKHHNWINSFLGKAHQRKIIRLTQSLSSLIIFMFFLTVEFNIFKINIFSLWINQVLFFLPQLIVAVIILISGHLISKTVYLLTLKFSETYNLSKSKFIPSISYAFTLTLSILIALQYVGIDIQFIASVLLSVLICVLLTGSISLGLGSSSIVNSILSCFYARKHFRIGDHITINHVSGKVIQISATSYSLESQGKISIVPAKFLNENIVNINREKENEF